MPFNNLSNIYLIKLLTIVRLALWYCAMILCGLSRTLFIVQTWSNTFIFLLILNLFSSLINLLLYKHEKYYRKLKYVLVVSLPLLTFSTLIMYLIYLWHIYYRIMNIVTINIMINDRSQSLLSNTLIYYQCCRIQDEILYDSANERDYFLAFPFCQNAIIENETRKDLWDNITTCSSLFRSIIFYIRTIFLVDLFLNITLVILCLIYLWEADDDDDDDDDKPSTILPPTYFNQKIK